MITILKCVGGRNKKGEDCTYEVEYKDTAYVVSVSRKVGGFDCPMCKRHGLRAYRKKE